MVRLMIFAKIALAFVWIFTGITSIFISSEIGFKILSSYGISGRCTDLALFGGSILDILLGVWVLSSQWIRICCMTQIAVILIYTLLLTIIDYSFWFHPFGPITKNFPIIVLILFVYQLSKSEKQAEKTC